MSAIHCTRASSMAMIANGARMKKPRIPSWVDRVGLATWRRALSCSRCAADSGSLATTRPVTRSSKRVQGMRPSADSATRSSTYDACSTVRSRVRRATKRA